MDEPFESQAISTRDLFSGKLQQLSSKPKNEKLKYANQRSELVRYFFEYAEPHWDAKKYGKLTKARFATKLSHLTQTDLFAFQKQGEAWCAKKGFAVGGETWAKFFWKALSPRPDEHGTEKPFARRVKSSGA